MKRINAVNPGSVKIIFERERDVKACQVAKLKLRGDDHGRGSAKHKGMNPLLWMEHSKRYFAVMEQPQFSGYVDES
ncbi:hypothetical protein AAHA92_00807 [Salvia divinorum]|uniref:Uncharacterized protein n=1 Tax=Salvia divinorum TaxID=28513 RepID=A0ABD1IKT3_SALDI